MTPAVGVLASSTLAVPSPENDSNCDALNGHQIAPEKKQEESVNRVSVLHMTPSIKSAAV